MHGGIDLQILGIGSNGHIGFNEPGTPFQSKTHLVELNLLHEKPMQDFSTPLVRCQLMQSPWGLPALCAAKKYCCLYLEIAKKML